MCQCCLLQTGKQDHLTGKYRYQILILFAIFFDSHSIITLKPRLLQSTLIFDVHKYFSSLSRLFTKKIKSGGIAKLFLRSLRGTQYLHNYDFLGKLGFVHISRLLLLLLAKLQLRPRSLFCLLFLKKSQKLTPLLQSTCSCEIPIDA